MKQCELFDNLKEYRPALTPAQRKEQASKIIHHAKLGAQYAYSLSEAASILHWSYDQIVDAVNFYKIDAFRVLSIVRIPWWSLAQYLLDPADDIDKAYNAYINALPRKPKTP